jgi:nucleolar protein 9
VLEELAPRAASAASDRHAGELIEVLLPRMGSAQLRFFLHKMEGYFSHLWTNRYSSHVLQHVLSRASAIVDKEVNGEADEDGEEEDERVQDTPRMSEIVVNMVTEVEREWLSLMNDVSASHVLRSVLALLAGRPLVPGKRGKKAKHRVVTFGDAKDGTQYAVPPSFDALLLHFVRTFRGAPTAQMLSLVYDANAGPLLAAALTLAPPKATHKLAQHLLQWSDPAASVQTFYDFAGDAVTSHVLEALFSSVSDDFFAAIFRRCLAGKLLEFAQHAIANYVVQHAVQRIATEDLAREVLAELDGAYWTLLSSGRAGVVWRVVQLSRRLGLQTRELYTAVVDAVAKQEGKKPQPVQRAFVPALLSLQLATGGSTKVQLNVLGAKLLFEFLQLEYAEYLRPLYQGIVDLNAAQLLALATDSTGSRCVVEPIWESADADRAWVRDALFAKFVGRFGALALDRLGAFSVVKCYERLSRLEDREVVAQELLAVEGKLSGSHFAQLVVNAVNLYEFRNNRDKWAALYEKKDKIADLFKDVVDDEGEGEPQKNRKIQKVQKTKRPKRKALESETTEDLTAIMGALRGSLDADKTKKKKKSKKQRRHEEEDA